MTRPFLRDVALICVGGLVAIAVLTPQLVAARADADRLRANERFLAHKCLIRPDGSIESCPAHTVVVDKVKP